MENKIKEFVDNFEFLGKQGMLEKIMDMSENEVQLALNKIREQSNEYPIQKLFVELEQCLFNFVKLTDIYDEQILQMRKEIKEIKELLQENIKEELWK